MPEVIDLSKLRDAKAPADTTDVQVPSVMTAFLVVITEEGMVQSIPYGTEVTPSRPANIDDVYGACLTVANDIEVQKVASATVTGMQQMMQQQMAQMDGSRLARQLGLNSPQS